MERYLLVKITCMLLLLHFFTSLHLSISNPFVITFLSLNNCLYFASSHLIPVYPNIFLLLSLYFFFILKYWEFLLDCLITLISSFSFLTASSYNSILNYLNLLSINQICSHFFFIFHCYCYNYYYQGV